MTATGDVYCGECQEPAEWERCTQFAGSHFFCGAHARLEKDFRKQDVCTVWDRVRRRRTPVKQTKKTINRR